ncbi:MAG: hypothetical protein IPM57_03785 [Oligoflexia bacterium]|nr:hypothetical protein [Oligoflexia bacterium]
MFKAVLFFLIAGLFHQAHAQVLNFKTWVRTAAAVSSSNNMTKKVSVSFEIVQPPQMNTRFVQINEVDGTQDFEGLVEPLVHGALQGSKFSNTGSYKMVATAAAEKADSFYALISYQINSLLNKESYGLVTFIK